MKPADAPKKSQEDDSDDLTVRSSDLFSTSSSSSNGPSTKSPRKEKSVSPMKPVDAPNKSQEDDSEDLTVRSSDLFSASSSSNGPVTKEIATDDEEESDIVETFVKSRNLGGKPLSDTDPKVKPKKSSAKSPSKGKQPKVPMIAVAENVQGKKCYFRLVEMTQEEVDAIDGVCIPYKLM
jgi:hypothetical protein